MPCDQIEISLGPGLAESAARGNRFEEGYTLPKVIVHQGSRDMRNLRALGCGLHFSLALQYPAHGVREKCDWHYQQQQKKEMEPPPAFRHPLANIG